MFRLFGRRRSRDDVKERLKLVLSYDRAKLSPGKMDELKSELLAVIGKYFPSTEQEYDVRFEQHGERMVLMADLPMAAGSEDDAAGNSGSTPAKTVQAGGNPAAGKARNRSSGKR